MKRRLKHIFRWLLLGGIAVLIAVGLFLFWPAPLPDVSEAKARLPQGQALIDRGLHLATAADCVACHTNPGSKPYAGGKLFPLPMGNLYSPNITPDVETGIGGWSDAQFVRAVRHGIDNEGRNLYPAFSYASYHLMTDEDALAIKAYLFSLPPVRAQNIEAQMMFPFNQRYLVRFWNLWAMPSGPLKPDTTKSDEWNKGAYLVEALAHCGECHTPRDVMFAMETSRKLSGASLGTSVAYNITPDKTTGIGNWTDAALIEYLSTGHADGHGSAVLGMGEAVDNSLRKLPIEDIRAMVAYLRDIPAKSNDKVAVKINDNVAGIANSTLYAPPKDVNFASNTGAQIFASSCASCHGWNGEGTTTSYGALKGAKTVHDPSGLNLMQVIIAGSATESTKGHKAMPSFGAAFSDNDIAQLSNFVLGHFGGVNAKLSAQDVAKVRPKQ